MSDNEAREETPPEYEEEIPTDWDIYVSIKGVLLRSVSNYNCSWYKHIRFDRILKVNTDPNFKRELPVYTIIVSPNYKDKTEVSVISTREYNKFKKIKSSWIGLPYVHGVEEDECDESGGFSNYHDIISLNEINETIFKDPEPRISE